MDEKAFVFGTAATGDNFTDRKKETHHMCANFRHGINTILISPRRWGKTSLVKKVISLTDSPETRVVYIDIFSCRNQQEFLSRFAEGVISQTSSRYEEWMDHIKAFLQRFNPQINMRAGTDVEFSMTLRLAPREDDTADILELPERIAQRKNCRIVVCIDEFQQIGEFSDSLTFQKELRTIWQHQSRTSYCLFGSKKHLMSELFQNSSYPFYNFGDIIFLDKISTSDWVAYIRARFDESGKVIDESLAVDICNKVENQSNYVQQLAWLLWINTVHTASRESLEESFTELIQHNSLLYERVTENLTGMQLNFLRAITDGIHSGFTRQEILHTYQLGASSNIRRLKDSLLGKDLIDITNHQVTIPDPVFRSWLQRFMFNYQP